MCSKIPLTMDEATDKVLSMIVNHPGQHPCRSYYCKWCGAWHITSQPKRGKGFK